MPRADTLMGWYSLEIAIHTIAGRITHELRVHDDP